MDTPIYRSLVEDGAVTALCGTRIYPSMLPQGAIMPAVVYTQVAGSPENYLGQAPGIDSYRTQMDVWAANEPQARELASKVRANLEQIGYVLSYNGQEYEPQTKRWRYSFDVGLFVQR